MKKTSKTIFIDAKHVCDRGKLDAQRLAIYFQRNGYEIIQNPKKADLIIFNSCGYNNTKAQKSFQGIEKYKKYKGELIVLGGLPDTDKEKFQKVFTGKTASHKHLSTIDKFFPDHAVKLNEIDDCNIPFLTLDSSSLSSFIKRVSIKFSITKKMYVSLWKWYLQHKYGQHFLMIGNPWDLPIDDIFYLRIAWGCSNKCSYCAIRKSVGELRSKPFDKCIQEFQSGLDQGFTKFHVIAVDPGSYGIDINQKYSTLLDTLTSFDGEYTIGLECVNPIWLVKYTNEMTDIIKRRKINVMSIPIQSANSRVLGLMNRFTDVNKTRDALKQLKKAYPAITLYTNCIVGFPTETMEEFQDTLNFLFDTDMDMGVLNPLSIKPGTKVETINPKVPQEEITRRIAHGIDFLQKYGYKTVNAKGGLVLFSKKH